MMLKRLLISFICFFVFVPAFLLINSVSYSKGSNLDFLIWQFDCSKHPMKHFVTYYFSPSSAHINSNNYKNHRTWKSVASFTVRSNGKVKDKNNKLWLVKMNNGRTYDNTGSLMCYAKGNKIYGSNNQYLGHIEKNGKIYGSNNQYLGHIEDNGKMYGSNNQYLGHIEDNGKMYGSNNQYLGHIKNNGKIYGSNNQYLGLVGG